MANQGGYTNTSQPSRRTSNDMSMDVLHHQKQQYQQQQYSQSSQQQQYTTQQPQQQYTQSSQQYTQASYSQHQQQQHQQQQQQQQQQQPYPTSNSSHQQPSYPHPSPSQVSPQHSPTSYTPPTSRMQINVNATTTPLPPPSYYHTTHAQLYSSPSSSPPSSQHSIISDLIHTLFNDLLNDVVADICHRVHKQGKMGILAPRMDVDVFGQNLKKMAEPIQKCDICGRTVGVTKFAPHLEKCLGKGRGTRTARQRKHVDYTNQLNGIDETAVAVAAAFVDEYKEDDGEDDGEYTVGKKRKLDKNGSTSKNKKPINGTTNGHSRNNNEYWCDPLPEQLPTHASVGGFPYAILREQMQPNENYGTPPTSQQISKMLEKICGVPSSTTNKMCCNKFTCKTHNDHDRNIAKQQIESGYYVIRIKRIKTVSSNGSKPSRSKPSTTAPAPTYPPPQVNYAYQ